MKIRQILATSFEVMEQVSAFTYLGSLITTTGGTEEDVKGQLQEGTGCILYFKTYMEIKVHRPPIRIYTWRLTKTIITQLQTFTNRRLRYILGVRWPRKISNGELWQRTKQEGIEVTIRRRKWRWIGHTLRKPATNITRLWNPQGVRQKGRPKKPWRRTIQ